MHVDLEERGSVERRVEQHEKALVQDVRSALRRVLAVFDDVLFVTVAVQQLVNFTNFYLVIYSNLLTFYNP